MDGNLPEASPSRSQMRFHDLDVVRLGEDVRTVEGFFPRGTRGTVVLVYEGAAAYEVEFEQPQPDVVTLRDDQLTSV